VFYNVLMLPPPLRGRVGVGGEVHPVVQEQVSIGIITGLKRVSQWRQKEDSLQRASVKKGVKGLERPEWRSV